MSDKLKAWFFHPLEKESCQFVFDHTEHGARILAAQYITAHHDPVEPQDVELHRCDSFDKYAPDVPGVGDVTDEQCHEEGWQVQCWHCEHRLDGNYATCDSCVQQAEADGEPEFEDSPVASGTRVFCSPKCLREFTEYHERLKEKKAAAIAMLVKKFPFVKPLGAWVGSPGECRGRESSASPGAHNRSCWESDSENIVVRFKVPGGELSEKTSDGNAFHNLFCFGCKRAWIARGDSEAFQAARSQTAQAGNA